MQITKIYQFLTHKKSCIKVYCITATFNLLFKGQFSILNTTYFQNSVCYTYSAWCSSFRYTGPPVFSWKLYPFFKFSSRHTSAALITINMFLSLQKIIINISPDHLSSVNKNKWLLHLQQNKMTWLAYLK